MSREPNLDLDADLVAQVLSDCARLWDPDADPELEAVKAAVLLEDSLGIVLTDDDISPDVLGDPAAVASLVGRLDRA